jgi:hypothetical protein
VVDVDFDKDELDEIFSHLQGSPPSGQSGGSIAEPPTPQSSESNSENTSSPGASSRGSSDRPSSEAGAPHQCPDCDKSYETIKKLSSVPCYILWSFIRLISKQATQEAA